MNQAVAFDKSMLTDCRRLAEVPHPLQTPEKPACGKCQIEVRPESGPWRTKGEHYVILPSWAASGHHRFGSDMQGRSAANAKLRFLRLIEEASDFASAAQV